MYPQPEAYENWQQWAQAWIALHELMLLPESPRIGSVVVNPAPIASGGSQTVTITVPRAQSGNFVLASFSSSLLGLTLTAYVSAANQVTAVFANNTGATVDLPEGRLRVRVIPLLEGE